MVEAAALAWIADDLSDLASSAEVLGALSAVFTLRSCGRRADIQVEKALDSVVDALGLRAVVSEAGVENLEALAGLTRARVLYAAALSSEPARAPGWRPRDSTTMLTQGIASREVAMILHAAVLPELTGLTRRLSQPGGSLLDVGTGVGGLAITLCGLYPKLSAVGIDVWEPALAIAVQRAVAVGLAERLRLRPQDVRTLDDEQAFDLCWLPVGFIAPDAIDETLRRMALATRPGGWIVLGMFGGASKLAAALAQLRAARFGGTFLRPREAESRLREAGWTDVRSISVAPVRSLWVAAGRQAGP